MKYVILADSKSYNSFKVPRQLTEINGETLLNRTVRLLKENGVKDILITSHDKRFEVKGAIRYEPLHNDYDHINKTGYWLSAFPVELLTKPITFIWGDVYFSENAIKKIVETKADKTMFFCTDISKGIDKKYIKKHDEPLAYKVNDTELFKKHIEIVKKLYDEGKTVRHPIVWELYRSINGLDINKHVLTTNYTYINDESCDIDTINDIIFLEIKLGGLKMVKCEVLKDFTLERFDELKNLVRKNVNKKEKGKLYLGDTFDCTEDMARYLSGENSKKEIVIKLLEVIPEKEKTIKAEEIPFPEIEKPEVVGEIIYTNEDIKPKVEIKKTNKKKKSKK